MTDTPRRAMTMREIRQALGHTVHPDGAEPDCTCDSNDNTHDGGCATAARLAASEPANPPRRVLTPGEHTAAWLAIEGAAGEPGACPGTVLTAVLRALDIDEPTT